MFLVRIVALALLLLCIHNPWPKAGYRSDAVGTSNWRMPIEPSVYTKTFHKIYDHQVRCNHPDNQIYLPHPTVLQEQVLALSHSSPATALYISKAQNASKTPTPLLRTRRKTFNLLGFPLNSTTSAYSKPDIFLSEPMSMPLFPHENETISMVILTTKLKRKKCKGNLGEHHFSWWICVKDCVKYELGFRCLHAKIGEVNWSSVTGNTTESHDRLDQVLLSD